MINKKYMAACRYEISRTVFNSISQLRNLSSTRRKLADMVNLLVVDFRSQSDCSIFRKESEKENE